MVALTRTDIVVDPVGLAVATLASCLSDQIEALALPEPCFVGVLPGAAVPMDVGGCFDDSDCDNGMAYTRLVNAYPSVSVGQAIVAPLNSTAGQGFDIEVGMFRCFPLTADGTSPPAEDMTAAFILQVADMRAMFNAVNCCDWGVPTDSFIVGTYAPIGPEGGVVGGTIPISGWLA